MRWCIPIFAFAACAPVEDRFAETSTACALGRDPTCDARLTEDFGAEGMPEWWFDGAMELVSLASTLTEPPQLGDYVRQPTLDWLDEVAGETLGARLYNRVSADTDQTVLGTPDGLAAEFQEGVVVWTDQESYDEFTALVIVHEAGHAHSPRHVLCPDGEELQCDEDWDGAYGKQLAVAFWGATRLEGLSRAATYWDVLQLRRSRVFAD